MKQFDRLKRYANPIFLAGFAIFIVWFLFLVFIALRVPSHASFSPWNPLSWFSVPAEIAFAQKPKIDDVNASQSTAVESKVDVAAVFQWRGQVGDSFGILTSLFTALSFFAVWWSLRLATKSSDEAQFFRELDNAIGAYNNHLKQLRVIDADKQNDNSGRNGLKRLWDRHLLFRLKHLASTELKMLIDDSESAHRALADSSNVNLLSLAECEALLDSESKDLGEWTHLTIPLDTESSTDFQAIQYVIRKVYHDFEHQLDALFRCCYHVFRLIDESESIALDVRESAARRFRAQLSWVELAWLLANQSLLRENISTQNPSKVVFPKAARLSERFEVFDNLSLRGDPVVTFLHQFWCLPDDQLSKMVIGAHLTAKAFGKRSTIDVRTKNPAFPSPRQSTTG